MINRLIVVIIFLASIVITGCNGLIYGDRLAPVVPLGGDNTQGYNPSRIISNNSSTTSSIENPNGVTIRAANENPYSNLPNRPSHTTAGGKVGRTENTGNINNINANVRQGVDVLAQEHKKDINKIGRLQIRPDGSKKSNNANDKVNNNIKKESTSANAVVRPDVPASLKTATSSLLQEAKEAISAGNYDKAASSLERAHRIEPGNAKILYDIAQIRYAQDKYRQAESFASKAATYSSSPILSKKIWTLLSNARKQLGDNTGAVAAAKKAADF